MSQRGELMQLVYSCREMRVASPPFVIPTRHTVPRRNLLLADSSGSCPRVADPSSSPSTSLRVLVGMPKEELLVTQCLYRIKPRSSGRRIQARQQANDH